MINCCYVCVGIKGNNKVQEIGKEEGHSMKVPIL